MIFASSTYSSPGVYIESRPTAAARICVFPRPHESWASLFDRPYTSPAALEVSEEARAEERRGLCVHERAEAPTLPLCGRHDDDRPVPLLLKLDVCVGEQRCLSSASV